MAKAKTRKEKIEFRGITEEDVENKFLMWEQANGETVWNIVKDPIRRRPLRHKPQTFQHRPAQIQDAFFIIVEYETNERKPKRSKD